MNNKMKTSFLVVTLTAVMCFTTSCSVVNTMMDSAARSREDIAQKEAPKEQSFAEAHDAFQTTLVEQNSDNDPIPDPPEGFFDLVQYPSKVGDLAAYVSSDPDDGKKHPLIIWVVGGWGNGNPGNYETLFGEVDDIVSAYDYAASLPYVDPDRIYLGGHSTGGTRALLAAEYTDKFRAVFGFGVVDKIEYHNNSQFTFDTDNEEEYRMRSPIYWLDSVRTPTFLIEGSGGNSSNLKNIERTSKNENIHCYIMEGQDHWTVLAPLTRVLAQKILSDTGAECNIAVTQEELDEAMEQEPEIPMPVMQQCVMDDLGITFSYPYLWNMEDVSENGEVSYGLTSRYEGNNAWDLSLLFFDAYMPDEDVDLQLFRDLYTGQGFDVEDKTVAGFPAIEVVSMLENDNGDVFRTTFVGIQRDDILFTFDFYIYEDLGDDADPMFDAIIDSIIFEQ